MYDFSKNTNDSSERYQKLMDSVRESIARNKAEQIYKDLTKEQNIRDKTLPKRDEDLAFGYPF